MSVHSSTPPRESQARQSEPSLARPSAMVSSTYSASPRSGYDSFSLQSSSLHLLILTLTGIGTHGFQLVRDKQSNTKWDNMWSYTIIDDFRRWHSITKLLTYTPTLSAHQQHIIRIRPVPVIVKYHNLLTGLFAFKLHCYIKVLNCPPSLIGITFIDLSELRSDQYPFYPWCSIEPRSRYRFLNLSLEHNIRGQRSTRFFLFSHSYLLSDVP
jgi:hypothetical protein